MSDVKKELPGPSKARRARDLALMDGEAHYKLYQASPNNLEKIEHLDKAIEADDQAVYRAKRAELGFHLTDYKGAQADANRWIKMMNRKKTKTGQEKIKNHPLQSLLFTTYLWTQNYQAAKDCLTKHFDANSPEYKKHIKELNTYNKK